MNVPMTLSNGKSIELNNITESGNGYIRFSDGTQICYESCLAKIIETNIQLNQCFSTNITFPKPFINFPVIVPSHQISFEGTDISYTHKIYLEGCISSRYGATIEFTNYNKNAFTETLLYVSYIAIGRWK